VFSGDNHIGYDGTHRAHNYVTFDLDLQTGQIRPVHDGASCGTSHRHEKITVLGKTVWKRKSTKRAVNQGKYKRNGSRSFTFNLRAGNPFLPGPKIDCNATLNWSGQHLKISGTTNKFPNIALRLSIRGGGSAVNQLTNVSGVDVTGVDGAANIFAGLTSSKSYSWTPV